MVPLYYYYLCTYCQIFLKIDVMLVFSYNADDYELLPDRGVDNILTLGRRFLRR